MASSTSSTNTIVVHKDTLKDKMTSEMYVDLETTRDREAREVLELLERTKLKDFCSLKVWNFMLKEYLRQILSGVLCVGLPLK